jgi:ATP-binding cassette subfamily B protein
MMSMIMGGLTLAIYWIGAYLMQNSLQDIEYLITTFSDMVVFSAYAIQVIMSFMMLIMLFIFMPRASVSAKRINEVFDTEPTITDGKLTEGKTGVTGEVEFKNVSFKYPGATEYVIKDINFTVSKGETIAFIGSTGSGKSTLINLLPRFYDATEGTVLIDGVDVKDYKGETLHNKIGYVSQKAALFRGTVSSNVSYGENAAGVAPTEDAIKQAVSIAQGTDFIEAMDGGYEAAISQGGTNVSGGQKQRISIARAVARSPEIYIFDDSFSALDYKTDQALRSALKRETAGVTSMIVAQRIGTIMDADKIIVLDEGVIVGSGTHKELLATCEVYKEIAMSQLSEEELAS